MMYYYVTNGETGYKYNRRSLLNMWVGEQKTKGNEIMFLNILPRIKEIF